MTDRPIIFSAPMVRAILSGTKTETRRIIKPQPDHCHRDIIGKPEPWSKADWDRLIPQLGESEIKLRFAAGDRLWVREAHRLTDCNCTEACRGPGHAWYEADQSGYRNVEWNRLRPSIHMPRWASRITLAVTEVRVERLQEITSAAAIREGISAAANSQTIDCDTPDPRDGFRSLWGSLHGPDAWDANPWVAVIRFVPTLANIDAPEKADG